MRNCDNCLYLDKENSSCMHKDSAICNMLSKNYSLWSPIPADKLSPSLRRIVVHNIPFEVPEPTRLDHLEQALSMSQEYAQELLEANARLTERNSALNDEIECHVETILQLKEEKRQNPVCPDCGAAMVKTRIEHDDCSGWFSGWGCECEYNPEAQ